MTNESIHDDREAKLDRDALLDAQAEDVVDRWVLAIVLVNVSDATRWQACSEARVVLKVRCEEALVLDDGIIGDYALTVPDIDAEAARWRTGRYSRAEPTPSTEG